jgi:hypothetical protein
MYVILSAAKDLAACAGDVDLFYARSGGRPRPLTFAPSLRDFH